MRNELTEQKNAPGRAHRKGITFMEAAQLFSTEEQAETWFDLTPKLVSLASRVQLPLQHTPLVTCLSTSCVEGRKSSLIPTVWNKEFTESAQDYMSSTNRRVKVLDFVQLGGFY